MVFALVVFFLACSLIVIGLCYIEVRAWLYAPNNPVAPQPTDSPFTQVTFTTEDNLTIYGWYAPSASGRYVLMFHGHSANRDQHLPHADYLLDAGYGVLLIDFRSHGDSDGNITSMGHHEIKDARSAYQFLMAQDDVQQVILWGHSMGGAVASRLMQEVSADGLVIDATFAEFPTIVRAGVIYRGFPPTPITEILLTIYSLFSGADWNTVRPIEHLASIDKPMLILHGAQDPIIPVSEAYRLADANPQIQLEIFEDGAHSNLYTIDEIRFRHVVMDYLNQLSD